MKIRRGMHYKTGDIVLIKFPFTNLKKAKKRPVLIIKNENSLGDFVCLQITSKEKNDVQIKIDSFDLAEGDLKLTSFVKYDKCFTLNANVVDKKLSSVNEDFLNEIKMLFCERVF